MGVTVKRILILGLGLALLAAGQQGEMRRPNRRSVLRKLSADVTAAMSRGTLKEKDRQKLDRARKDLGDIADLKVLGRVDREDLRKALGQVKKRSGSFQAADREAVLEDLREAHRMGLDRGAPVRTVRPRQPRPIYLPRPWPAF